MSNYQNEPNQNSLWTAGLFASDEIAEQCAAMTDKMAELIAKAPIPLSEKLLRLRTMDCGEAQLVENALKRLQTRTSQTMILRGYETAWGDATACCIPAMDFSEVEAATALRPGLWYVLDIWEPCGTSQAKTWSFVLNGMQPIYFVNWQAAENDPERYARELIFAPNNISPLRISPVIPAGTMLRVKAAPFFPEIEALAVSREQVVEYGIPDWHRYRTLTDLQDGALFGTEMRNIVPLIYCLAPADEDVDGIVELELWDHAELLSAHAPRQTAELLVHWEMQDQFPINKLMVDYELMLDHA